MDRSTLNLSTTLSSLNQNNNNNNNTYHHHHHHHHNNNHSYNNQVQQFTTSSNSQHQQMNLLHNNNNDQRNNQSTTTTTTTTTSTTITPTTTATTTTTNSSAPISATNSNQPLTNNNSTLTNCISNMLINNNYNNNNYYQCLDNNNSYLNQDHINNTELCEIGHDDISLFLDSIQQQQFYDHSGSTITQPIVIPTTTSAVTTTTTSTNNPSSNYITTTTTTAPITNMLTDDAALNSYLPYEGLIKENTCNIANQLQNSHVKYSDLQSPPYSLYEGVSPCTSSNDTNISLYSLSISQDPKAKKKRKIESDTGIIGSLSTSKSPPNTKSSMFRQQLSSFSYDNDAFSSCDIKNDYDNYTTSDCSSKSISFKPFKIDEWVTLYDEDHELIEPVQFQVEADKGFSYSTFDDAFVCQKKNHFQITAHTTIKKEVKYFKYNKALSDYQEIDSFQLQFYGVKQESQLQIVPIKQSDTNRKPIDYVPYKCRLETSKINKLTVKRLHFAYTTQNNNRKKNKPNPEQRYFLLIVEMQLISKTGESFVLYSAASERLIVRAVNPGQYNQEDDANKISSSSWSSNLNEPGSLYYYGKVGINTEQTDEALNVVGNIKLNGVVIQPSDMRVKSDIKMIETSEALGNISKLKIYEYNYKPEFAQLNGLQSDVGLLAQEVKQVIPDAVIDTGDLALANGEIVENFLHVDKGRVYMECVGAVIELGKKTDQLDDRIEKLEQQVVQLPLDATELTSLSTQQTLTNEQGTSIPPTNNNTNDISETTIIEFVDPKKAKKSKRRSKSDPELMGVKSSLKSRFPCCSSRLMKITVIITIFAIAFGVAAILAIQIVQHLKSNDNVFKNDQDDNSDGNANMTQVYYPKVLPPVIIPPICASNSSHCKVFCCDISSRFGELFIESLDTNTPTPTILLKQRSSETVLDEDQDDYISNSNVNSNNNNDVNNNNNNNNTNDESINVKTQKLASIDDFISTVPLQSVSIYSYVYSINMNLSVNSSCVKPYCEYLNNKFIYFVPLSRYIDPRASLELLFHLQDGYQIKHCNLNYDGVLCTNMHVDLSLFDDVSVSNATVVSFSDGKKFIYYTPAAYFMHIDLEFRVSFDNQIDLCSLNKKVNTNSSKIYRTFLFRFFRLCST